MAENHHHRSGPLKQKNKTHKTGKHESKKTLSKLAGGKIERKSNHKKNVLGLGSKQKRLNKVQLLRQQKKQDALLRKRAVGFGPPKVIGIVALGESADLPHLQETILKSATKIVKSDQDKKIGAFSEGYFAQHKLKVKLFDCGSDLMIALDVAKVADVIMFVLPMHNGSENCISTKGDSIITAIRSQGVPSIVGVIQGLNTHPTKVQADLKKFGLRFFKTEFGDSIKTAEANNEVQLTRALTSVQPKTIHWREIRSYLIADNYSIENNSDSDTGLLKVTGYIRGRPLSVNQLVHIPDIGTFQMQQINEARTTENSLKETPNMIVECSDNVLALSSSNLQQDLQYEAAVDPFASEQTWPTEEELQEAEDAKVHRENDSKSSDETGMSSYQSSWMPSKEEEILFDSDHEEISQDFCATGHSVKNKHTSDDDMDMIDDDEETRKAAYEELQNKRKQENEEVQFPDEVNVPGDSLAKVRFARYRGLKSFRTSPWDPKESLPSDYARLFQFKNFEHTQRAVLSKVEEVEQQFRKKIFSQHGSLDHSKNSEDDTMDISKSDEADFTNGYIEANTYVTIYIKNISCEKISKRNPRSPLILGSVLKHENRLSVLNFSVQRNSNFTDPVKSKEVLTFHVGFQRFKCRPIFSDQNLNSDKHKFQRFLPQGGWSVASVYGPTTFQPSPVLIFREGDMINQLDFVASGTLLHANPDRIVLKRIVVTGVPVRVKNRKAVVRYMFHKPADINWFKPIELTTKHGMTGHIKESLGTHGDFKALFNKPIKQHDTVCINLYKRVYPKFIKDEEHDRNSMMST